MKPLHLTSSQLEMLKWLALLAMTGDHINKYLLNYTVMPLYELGRLAMPVFGFVLAYNLAGRGAVELAAYDRVQRRLLIFALVASPFYILLGGVSAYGLPLNILFTLLMATILMRLTERATLGSPRGLMVILVAVALFLASGWVVEFSWQALAWCWFVWLAIKTRSRLAVLLAIASLASLTAINGTWWAMGALPVILLATIIPGRFFRLRHFFYWYYPAHLAAIYFVRLPMIEAGHWFIVR